MSDLTFFRSEKQRCPICSTEFQREVLRSGRGRVNAGDNNKDLYRNYIKTEKYGEVFPLLYSSVTCPGCLYSTYPDDFNVPKDDDILKQNLISGNQIRRKKGILFFGKEFDFTTHQTLLGGVWSCFSMLGGYSHFDDIFAPTFKRALASLRLSWFLREILFKQKEGDKFYSHMENVEDMYWHFRIVARKLYYRSYLRIDSEQESIDSIQRYGPDSDVDYGFDGLLYIMGYLFYEQRALFSQAEKEKYLDMSMFLLSRSFGLGETSKEKPSALLYRVKELVGLIRGEKKKSG